MRAVTLLSGTGSTSDPIVSYLACKFLLLLSRRCLPAPAPGPLSSPTSPPATEESSSSPPPGDDRRHDIAKSVIEAGGLGALWTLCTYPPQMASPVALAALAAFLGTAAAMSRSAAASAAVLSLVSDGIVGRLARENVDPALAVLAAWSPQDRNQPRGASADSAIAAGTSALLALHYLATNPDPEVHGLFLAVAEVDSSAVASSGHAGGSAWSLILSSVETAADGRAGSGFLEAALLAAGSVCGAPPLPPPQGTEGGGSSGVGSPSKPEEIVARILPTYEARAREPTSVEATTTATARGLAKWTVALFGVGVGGSSNVAGSGAPATADAADKGVVATMHLQKQKVSRAAIRVAWALSRNSEGATALAAGGALPQVMDLFSAGRAHRKDGNSGNGGAGGDGVGHGGTMEVLVLETIAAFLSLEGGDGRSSTGALAGAGKGSVLTPTSGLSAETVAAMSRAVGELCEIVLDSGGGQGEGVENGGSESPPPSPVPSSASLVPRSLALLASAAANPRLRPLLVDHPHFPDVLDLLLTNRRSLGGSSSSSVSVHGLLYYSP